MPLVRTIFAALLLLAWMPATNGCVLPAAFAEWFSDPCGSDGCGSEETGEVSCSACVALESGLRISELKAFAVTAPAVVEDRLLMEMLGATMRLAAENVEPPLVKSPPPDRSVGVLLVRTALPVRGPSFA